MRDESMALMTKKILKRFAKLYQLRDDWHEPDEQNVTARVTGDHLDNAFGTGDDVTELQVILCVDGQEVIRVNLATLLATAVL